MIDRSIQYNSRKDHLQMDTSFIKGVVVPILTICDKDEKIDEAKQRAQVDYVIKGGVTGILAFGSNGEFYMLEEDEMERGLKIMVDQAAGRVPVYFGIGAISTKKSCRLAKMAVKNGAAAVSVLQPMFLKPTYDELYNHFKTIAESVPETPMLLYNNPGRVGYTLSAKLVEELAHNVPNIIGMSNAWILELLYQNLSRKFSFRRYRECIKLAKEDWCEDNRTEKVKLSLFRRR